MSWFPVWVGLASGMLGCHLVAPFSGGPTGNTANRDGAASDLQPAGELPFDAGQDQNGRPDAPQADLGDADGSAADHGAPDGGIPVDQGTKLDGAALDATQPQSDAGATACAAGTAGTSVAADVVSCAFNGFVDQCAALAGCNGSAGWQPCAASQYLGSVASGTWVSPAWLGSCVRDGPTAPTIVPSEQPCSSCATTSSGATRDYQFACGSSGFGAGSNHHYVGVMTGPLCWGLGPDAASAVEGRWQAQIAGAGAAAKQVLCCR